MWQHYQVMKDHSKVSKIYFWMIQSAKKEVIGRFLDLGLLDQLDIAYYDRTECFLTFDNLTRSWRISQKSQKCIFWMVQLTKKEVSGHFLLDQRLDMMRRCNGMQVLLGQVTQVDMLQRVPGCKVLTLRHWPRGQVTVLNFSWGQAWECWSVCLSVSPCAKVTENRAKDFLAFWHECSLL